MGILVFDRETIFLDIYDDDWYRHGLGALFSEALSACWKHLRSHVESKSDLHNVLALLMGNLGANLPVILRIQLACSSCLSGYG